MHQKTIPLGPVEYAGLDITKQHNPNESIIKLHKYDVKHHCCGLEESMMRDTITSKVRATKRGVPYRDTCKFCANVQRKADKAKPPEKADGNWQLMPLNAIQLIQVNSR